MWGTSKIIDLVDYVPVPSFEVTDDVKRGGDTDDIIEVVVKDDKEAAKAATTRKLAKLLETNDEYETCRKIFRNVQHNIQYVGDKTGHEVIKMPNALLYYRKGDCKSYSVLIADLLRGVHGGIKCEYWFVSQSILDPTPTHVFPVAILSDGTEVFLDAISDSIAFDESCIFYHKTVKEAAI